MLGVGYSRHLIQAMLCFLITVIEVDLPKSGEN